MRITSMAWRNVWRNRRRSIVTVAAMTLALLVMILYSGLIAGYLRQMEESILEIEVGDVQIHADGYLDSRSLYTRVPDPAGIVGRLEEAGFRASPRLVGSGLVASDEASAGVRLTGVDVARDQGVSAVHARVAAGAWLDPADPQGIVIGRSLARTLATGVDGELVLLSQGADGSTANDVYRVRGILGRVSGGIDRAGVFLTDAAFRELMVVPDGVHQIIVRRQGNEDLDLARERIAALAPGQDVKTWPQLMPTLASMFESSKAGQAVMMVIVYFVIAIVVLNAMLMAVFERIREFGVLKAVGFGPWKVLRLIYAESAILTGLALVIGGLLAIPGAWYMVVHGIDLGGSEGIAIGGVSLDPIVHSVIGPETWSRPMAMLVVLVGLAVLYPASKAARIRPVEAIRHR